MEVEEAWLDEINDEGEEITQTELEEPKEVKIPLHTIVIREEDIMEPTKELWTGFTKSTTTIHRCQDKARNLVEVEGENFQCMKLSFLYLILEVKDLLKPSACDRRFVRNNCSIKTTNASKGDDVSTASTKCGETAMLVIDMQNDYVLSESPTRIVGANAIVPSVIEVVSVAREHGILVIWVVREHDKQGRDVELFRRHLYTDGVGPALQRSKGAELVEGLVIQDGDYKLVKTRFSAFFATNLDLVLKSCGINNLVVVGIQTPNCIRQTVFDAVSLDYKHVTVITDATAAATPEIHLANIEDMKNIGSVWIGVGRREEGKKWEEVLESV
ncbi:Peroxyureidoacrylate/ureidoacrylate amidohydrolase RutB [Rhynchospora pubera]|uniref:Peroxyureidoacrylate/ureidoacrylate amidohydrolase RutB n=1 Tax=Rhynchospora pubera TaxID=906938 RepID=A0AAV8GLX1_9POAL|nr:Peroxyureidoacrylate/ureidoacrylate amidohydrolase RutB [Rhynchospora pubera]